MTQVMKLLEILPQTWRGVLSVVGILGAGLTGGWTAKALFGQASELPERVMRLEATAERHSVEIEAIRSNAGDLERKVDRVLCLVESQAEIRPVSECVR